MIAICPAGPPKLMNPSFSQNQKASDSGKSGGGAAAVAVDAGVFAGGVTGQV